MVQAFSDKNMDYVYSYPLREDATISMHVTKKPRNSLLFIVF
jgi:hypothetical protein